MKRHFGLYLLILFLLMFVLSRISASKEAAVASMGPHSSSPGLMEDKEKE